MPNHIIFLNQGPWQTLAGSTGEGDAAGEAMDLTRRQREQRKKDIRSKVTILRLQKRKT